LTLKPTVRNSMELISIVTGGRDVSTSDVHSWNVSPDVSSYTLLRHHLMTRVHFCRSVCPNNPPTCDVKDWTDSHNLYHYKHHQTHTTSDTQVTRVYPLQWTITSESKNPTHRTLSRSRPGQPTLIL
jgi:hypothetical protein